MSYQVLARKWRPKNFSEVAGQAHVLKSLINALDNQRLHHAYLFTGTRGVGKTTLARILAKCLNCEEGVTSTPCDVCGSCTEINEGRFIDLMEVDAASRTKVEDTRELLENVQYTPTRGRYKVYLIDEVHMLSTHSFNALLKTLEEPPEHVKFLFATTDPQKLPITILSRCLQFNLKNLSPQLIVEYLISVLQKEAIEFEEDALWQIAAAAAGSMRDALTLVDQAISYCEGKIDNAGVLDMLGVPAQRQVYDLLHAMAQGDIAGVLALINTMAEETPDFNQMLDSLLSVLHRIAMSQVLPQGIDNSFGDRQQLQELAGQFSAEDVQLYYQFGVKGREDLRIAPEARAAFEMLVIRMLVFSPSYVPHDDSTPTQGDSKSAAPSSEAATDGAGTHAPTLAEPVAETPAADATSAAEPPEQAEPAELKKKTELSAEKASELTDATLVTAEAHPEILEVSPSPTIENATIAAATPSNTAAEDQAGKVEETPETVPVEPARSGALKPSSLELQSLDHDKWLKNYPHIQVNGIAANILANVEFARASSNEIHFILDLAQSSVYHEDILPKISQILSGYFQCELQVFIEVSTTTKETAAQLSQRLKNERHTEMVTDFEQDANVQELLQRFSGTLAKDSIAPLEKATMPNSEQKIKSR